MGIKRLVAMMCDVFTGGGRGGGGGGGYQNLGQICITSATTALLFVSFALACGTSAHSAGDDAIKCIGNQIMTAIVE